MAMTKAEVREAFREAMASNYADVPPKDELDHTFSPEFCAKMETLIADQKRGAWRMKSRRYKRTLVVAALLAAALLLVACTPRVRYAMAKLAVTIYETFVKFTVDTSDDVLCSEIERVYCFDPIPEGFELESQTKTNAFRVDTVYKNNNNERIVIIQTSPEDFVITTDLGDTAACSRSINGIDVLFSTAGNIQTAFTFYDGYCVSVRYSGNIKQNDFEELIAALFDSD